MHDDFLLLKVRCWPVDVVLNPVHHLEVELLAPVEGTGSPVGDDRVCAIRLVELLFLIVILVVVLELFANLEVVSFSSRPLPLWPDGLRFFLI